MMPGSGGRWYWPGSSVVSGDKMLVFAYVVRSTGPDAFDFAIDGTAVATYQLPSLQLISGPDPMPLTTAPNGGDPIPGAFGRSSTPPTGPCTSTGPPSIR
jgi:hypothetical protein